MLSNLKFTMFGESHSKQIGFTLEGLPHGIEIDHELISTDLERRRPKSKGNTSRIEKDKYEIISGYFNNVTTGAPLTVIVNNENTNSKDYVEGQIRPSHADYPAYVKYDGYNDYRGGGVFSGRLTVLHVIAGAICKMVLAKYGIVVGSEISNVNGLENDELFDINSRNIKKLSTLDFPSLNEDFIEKAEELITEAKHSDDSIGGQVRTYALNLPVGLGDLFLNSCESRIAHMFFSIPSVKGVSFGEGENFANLFGSEANDTLYYEDGNIRFDGNSAGGINGGLTNGQPLVVNTTFKAPSSIGLKQDSINIKDEKNIKLEIKGRHDAFILDRVCVVLDNALAIVLLDLIIDYKKRGK